MTRRHYAARVVKFLTDEWVSALDHAAGAHVSLVTESFVVEYRVDMEDGDPFVYQIRFDGGSVAATRSSTATPTVVLTTDRATARRIASNDLSAQAAFMAGQVRLDGDTMALVRNHDALARLDEVFNDVRLLTEY
jgi:putative sterol carrier protein